MKNAVATQSIVVLKIYKTAQLLGEMAALYFCSLIIFFLF